MRTYKQQSLVDRPLTTFAPILPSSHPSHATDIMLHSSRLTLGHFYRPNHPNNGRTTAEQRHSGGRNLKNYVNHIVKPWWSRAVSGQHLTARIRSSIKDLPFFFSACEIQRPSPSPRSAYWVLFAMFDMYTHAYISAICTYVTMLLSSYRCSMLLK